MPIRRGAQHGRAKLTTAQVLLLRRLWRTGGLVRRHDARGRLYTRRRWGVPELARRFRLSPRHIRRIVGGEYWDHA